MPADEPEGRLQPTTFAPVAAWAAVGLVGGWLLRPLAERANGTAPIVTWLASPESAGVTGQVFQVWGDKLGVAEGWVLGPSTRQPDDPAALGPIVADLVARARPASNMFGKPRT